MLVRKATASCTAFSQSAAPRRLHDLVSHGPARAPSIAYGPPGRSADSGRIATVFGCTGFLGRYLVAKLAKAGTKVIVPYREEDDKRHLKVMGDLGQIISMEWDLRSEAQTEECIRHSDIVYNLVGREYPTKRFSYHDVNVTGVSLIAKVAHRLGTPRFVHVSHLNASKDSSSEFYRTKAEGEEALREILSYASIVRPGPMFGPEDRFINSMATHPLWWHLNHAATKVKPAHVLDVAQALYAFLDLPAQARTYSLPGPRTYTYEDLIDLISSVTYNALPSQFTLPKRIALLASRAAQAVWWPVISPDQVERRYIDDVDVGLGDWADLGVEPEPIEMHALKYLRRYRTVENFSRPLVLPADRKPQNNDYIVD